MWGLPDGRGCPNSWLPRLPTRTGHPCFWGTEYASVCKVLERLTPLLKIWRGGETATTSTADVFGVWTRGGSTRAELGHPHPLVNPRIKHAASPMQALLPEQSEFLMLPVALLGGPPIDPEASTAV